MIRLLPIEQDDFDAFLERGIVDYAKAHVRNGDWREEEALELSRQQWHRLLPGGRNTKDEFIYSIFDEASNQNIGVLWVEVKMDEPHRRAFIYDIVIEKPFRRKGYGRQALYGLDERLGEMQVESVALHVFGDDPAAIELYKKVGYEITDMHMRKTYR